MAVALDRRTADEVDDVLRRVGITPGPDPLEVT